MTDEHAPSAAEEEELQEGTLVSHLVELRNRLLKTSAAILGVFVCLVPFSEQIFTLVATPRVSDNSSFLEQRQKPV